MTRAPIFPDYPAPCFCCASIGEHIGGHFNMAARLGRVLGWAGNIIGGLTILLWAVTALTAATDDKQQVMVFILFAVPGVVIILLGQACRYVLSGK